jgi:CheY-like chemotaxis protein
LAEDHEDSREALRQLLEYFGASVEAADSGTTALAALALLPGVPDVILADIRMPGMDGLELAHRLEQEARWRDIPRVAVTANTSMAALHATLEAGYRAHIGKPIDPDVLVITLQRVLSRDVTASHPTRPPRRPRRRRRPRPSS